MTQIIDKCLWSNFKKTPKFQKKGYIKFRLVVQFFFNIGGNAYGKDNLSTIHDHK